jgi:uncharacterized phiE125 gp8 family phage protein
MQWKRSLLVNPDPETPYPTPVTYAEVRAHLRLDDDTERDYIQTLITTATEYAEEVLGMALSYQSIEAKYFDGDTATGFIELPRGPAHIITAVGIEGEEEEVDPDTYQLRSHGTKDYIWTETTWDTPFTVYYNAGFDGSSADHFIPARIKHAIMLHVAHLYRFREASSDKAQHAVAHGLDAIYANARRAPIIAVT